MQVLSSRAARPKSRVSGGADGLVATDRTLSRTNKANGKFRSHSGPTGCANQAPRSKSLRPPGRRTDMAAVTERQILEALGRVADPDRGADIVSLGMVSGVVARDGNVAFAIEVEPERGPRLEPLRRAAEKAVEALPDVLSVTAVLTAQAVPRGRNAPHPAAGGRTQRGAIAGVNAIVAVA